MASFEKRYVRFIAKERLSAKIAVQKVVLRKLRQDLELVQAKELEKAIGRLEDKWAEPPN